MKNATETKSVIDPVCGMTIDPKDAAASVEFEGNVYHFCATACRDAFQESPKLYAAEEEKGGGSCCGSACCSA